MQRDPRNFSPLPDSFWPERWLIAEGLQSFSSLPEAQTYQGEFIHNSTAFVPFSHGPYNCVGKNLAMLEMKMLLCHTVQQLEFSIDEKWDVNEWEKEMYDFFVMKKGKLPVVVSLRHS